MKKWYFYSTNSEAFKENESDNNEFSDLSHHQTPLVICEDNKVHKNMFDAKRHTTIFKTEKLVSKIEHPEGCIPSSDKDAFICIMEESEVDKKFHKIKQIGRHLSIKDKKKIIDFYNIQKQSRSKISQLLNILYSTIRRVIKGGYSQFEEDKNIENDANSYTKLNSTLK